MTTFGTLLPKPVDQSLTYLSEEDWKQLHQRNLINNYQMKLTKEVLNAVKSVPPEIIKPNHIKAVFRGVIAIYENQYLPSGEVKQ